MFLKWVPRMNYILEEWGVLGGRVFNGPMHPLVAGLRGFLNLEAAITVWIRWNQGHESPMGLQVLGVSKP
jgi:hypothetical protein